MTAALIVLGVLCSPCLPDPLRRRPVHHPRAPPRLLLGPRLVKGRERRQPGRPPNLNGPASKPGAGVLAVPGRTGWAGGATARNVRPTNSEDQGVTDASTTPRGPRSEESGDRRLGLINALIKDFFDRLSQQSWGSYLITTESCGSMSDRNMRKLGELNAERLSGSAQRGYY